MVFSEQGLGCGVGPPNAQFVMSPPYGGNDFFKCVKSIHWLGYCV